MGLRYRLHAAILPGRPDIVFPSRRAAVFVHGCFWHRHAGCRIATTPKSNTPFWQAKFDRNAERDVRNTERLAELGWTVIVVWECDLSTPEKAGAAAVKVVELLPAATRPSYKRAMEPQGSNPT
jgi:DNA mismatch endonuclease (patch repair protein)